MANGKGFNGMAKLLVQVAIVLLAAAVVWGAVRHQVADNTKDIDEIKTVDIVKIDEAKLDKEVFKMYAEQQQKASEKTDKMLDKIDGKLDKALSHEHER